MGVYRPDGSYDSANNPVEGNIYVVRDYATHKAQVEDVLYTDEFENESLDSSNPRVKYTVRIIGGPRDGQLFANVEDLHFFGGISNYSERTWKSTKTINSADPGDTLRNTEELPQLNGDVVYIQFISGDLNYPIILGGAKHASNRIPEATEEEGPRLITRFNGIKTSINKDGEYAFIKANGKYEPNPVEDPEDNLPFLKDQFVPEEGFLEAVKVTLGNDFDLSLKMNVEDEEGLEINIDGLKDLFEIKAKSGSQLQLDGTTDLFDLTTNGGAKIALDGNSDALNVNLADGASLVLSADAGFLASEPTGAEITLSSGEAKIQSSGGAFLTLGADGLIKFGNSSDDAMQIVGDLIQSLSTATYAGFGAPGSNAPQLAQILVRWKLLSG